MKASCHQSPEAPPPPKLPPPPENPPPDDEPPPAFGSTARPPSPVPAPAPAAEAAAEAVTRSTVTLTRRPGDKLGIKLNTVTLTAAVACGCPVARPNASEGGELQCPLVGKPSTRARAHTHTQGIFRALAATRMEQQKQQ